ncbi:MAG: hypothetical protein NT026_02430 [Candidatus Staskawiczbacteria bacterium]|nr:hypothetical protein [Candidatus Staskawiczbacteria bacterium]
MLRRTFVLAIVFLSIGVLTCSVAFVSAESRNLFGYVYSESEGWISLSCENTNSCNTVDYKVFKDDNGKLSGFGFSQNGLWVNFNPNYGGVSINSANELSGWAYSESSNWLRIGFARIFSVSDLQNKTTFTESVLGSSNLSGADLMSLLNNLCNQFLNSSECSVLININK